jgi:hypothetical protein
MYAMVSADFPGVTPDQRAKIYKCLEANNWKKFENVGRDITTCWFASFENNVSYDSIIKITTTEFTDCSKPYCKPRLVIHVGSVKPIEIIVN